MSTFADPNENEGDELLENLESIKTLLEDTEAQASDGQAEDLPMLDEPAAKPSDPGLPEPTFKALLDEAWQDSMETILDEARDAIEDNSTEWLPEDTDALSRALKVRIDAAVREWLESVLRENVGALRAHLVTALSEELMAQLDHKLSSGDLHGR